MTLQQIQYVLTVAEVGSISKAAEILFVSQPTITSAIKELENELEIVLFHRSHRGMTQTAAGAEFLVYARQIQHQYEMVFQKYGKKENVRQKFTISTQHYSFAVKAFVGVLQQFGARNYDFIIRETDTLSVIQDVGASRSEIGILYRSSLNQKFIAKLLRENDLEFHPLVACSAMVYLWEGHPLANRRSISMDELEPYPCLSFEQGERDPFYLAEEILTEKEYLRTVKIRDRATMGNLLKGINGYTLCSGIICEDFNSRDCVVVPFRDDERNPNRVMEVGYIVKKHSIMSDIGVLYLEKAREILRDWQEKGAAANADSVE